MTMKVKMYVIVNTSQKHCAACRRKRYSILHQSRATLSTQNYITQWKFKRETFCSNHQIYSHSVILMNGAKGLRTAKQPRTNTSPPPDPLERTRTIRYANQQKSFFAGLGIDWARLCQTLPTSVYPEVSSNKET